MGLYGRPPLALAGFLVLYATTIAPVYGITLPVAVFRLLCQCFVAVLDCCICREGQGFVSFNSLPVIAV